MTSAFYGADDEVAAVESLVVDHFAEFFLAIVVLDVGEVDFDRVVLRRVGNVEDGHHVVFLHVVPDLVGPVDVEVVHEDSNLLALHGAVDALEKLQKPLGVDTPVEHEEVDDAVIGADAGKESDGVGVAEVGVNSDVITNSGIGFLGHCGMSEHAFIDEDDFSAIFEGKVDLSFEFLESSVVSILGDSSLFFV